MLSVTVYAVIRPSDDVDGDFLYQHILSDKFVEFLKRRMTGSNYPAVTAADVEVFPLQLPPLVQQRKIGATLRSVDDTTKKTQAVIEQVKVVKRGGTLQQTPAYAIGQVEKRPSVCPPHWRPPRHLRGRTDSLSTRKKSAMTNPPAWNEQNLSEAPAVDLLRSLGYTYIRPEALEDERASLKDAILTSRLADALRRLNPWVSEANVTQAIRKVTQVSTASLLEANQAIYTSLTYGVALDQGRGEGRKSRTVRFFDFDEPKHNDWIVTRDRKSVV